MAPIVSYLTLTTIASNLRNSTKHVEYEREFSWRRIPCELADAFLLIKKHATGKYEDYGLHIRLHDGAGGYCVKYTNPEGKRFAIDYKEYKSVQIVALDY
jgi:hypothetical protein